MPPKKEKPKAMSLSSFHETAPGKDYSENLPTRSGGVVAGSGGKGFRGKGMRDNSPSRADGDWGRGGKGDDRGGKGKRRDEPTRADTEDWLSKDRGGGGGGMDRDRGGGMDRRGPPRGDRDREREDNGAAAQDDNWRGNSGRNDRPNDIDRRSNFRDRDRDDRDRGGGGGGFSRTDSTPSERPRLNLKPRSAPTPDGAKKDETPSATATGARKYVPPSQRSEAPKADDKPERPWLKSKKSEGDDKDEDDGFTAVGKTATRKYVPPVQRGKVEPVKEAKDEKSDSDDDKDSDSASSKSSKSNKSDKKPAKAAPAPRRFDDEPAPRPARSEAKGDESGGLASLKKGTGGKYVPPGRAREEADRKQKEEEGDAAREKAAEERRAKADADAQAARKAKNQADAQKEAEKQAKRDKEQKEREDKKKDKEAELKKKQDDKKKSTPEEEESKPINEEKLSEFGDKCTEFVAKADADVKKLVSEVPKLLGEIELRTVEPVKRLLEPLMRFCQEKDDKEVVKAVERFAPLFTCLIEEAQMKRFKVKLLREAQRIAHQMGLPRLSPASALLEAFFDGLYQAEVVEEQFFELWTDDLKDDTPGKIEARFQLDDFLDWLRNAKVEGQDSEDEDDDQEEKDEEEEDEDSDADIEANVPQRPSRGARPLR